MLRTIDVGAGSLTRERLIEEIRAFMRRARVGEVWLYGSWARGDQREWSDVDLLVVSQRFQGTRFIDRPATLYKHWDILNPYADLLAYTPEEFERAREGLGIEREAARTGIRITLEEDAATA
jgi:predicted nucleotidyltransferase